MRVVRAENCRSLRLVRLMGAAALTCMAAVSAPYPSAHAQDLGALGSEVSQDGQMLIEADTLVYDNDRNTVSAAGNVQIDYDGNQLVAERVTYDRESNRLIASGDVEIIDGQGNTIYADEIDVTDDFRDGFVEALQVVTPDKTYFGADSAVREDGTVTTFDRGVYTACEPCEDPDKAPVWRIKARKIIWDGKSKTVRYHHARFELYGLPIAYFPFFQTADPTVKRKSGFLMPSLTINAELGTGVTLPYYFALSPTYDLTAWGTYYAQQGFLGEAEWRQRFDNGAYSVKIAGISQRKPEAFGSAIDSTKSLRGMVGTQGSFKINPRWTFGWDVLAQSDKNFSNRYSVVRYDNAKSSEIFLTGLHDRNYFDLRASRFFIQESYKEDHSRARSELQPWVLPSLDYERTLDEPVAGGQLSLDVNAQHVLRDRLSATLDSNDDPTRINGPEGNSGRLTAEAVWKRRDVTSGGLVLTSLLAARGDAVFTNYSAGTQSAIAALGPSDLRSSYQRYMGTAGLEARWPILFQTKKTSHVVEPIAQIFVRPDEPYAGVLGIPNEDSQSLVFDASTLFERDKFSGYDRIEGGTRANLGIRYSGDFGGGWTVSAVAGQSFHLAGVNSFATPDLVNAGAESGLETDRSDYVGMVSLLNRRSSLTLSGRFDETDFALRRADVTGRTRIGPVRLNARYTFIEAQPTYGIAYDRHEFELGGRVQVAENWSAFASATYDFDAGHVTRNRYGFTYDDRECFIFSLAMVEKRSRNGGNVNRNFSFRVALRTLGDVGVSSSQVNRVAN